MTKILRVLLTALLVPLLPAAALGSRHGGGGGQDRVGMFTTISISEDHPAGDVACMFCTVNLDGDVHGDVAVLFGRVTGSADRNISGDVALLFSTLRLGDNTRIRGDLATAFSTVDVPATAAVAGDRAIFGTGLGLTVLLAPLLVVAGVIWLIVFLVRENRRRYVAFPSGQRRF